MIQISFLYFLLSPVSLFADSAVAELSKDPVWLKLLHYEKSLLPGSQLVSAVSSADFFLSETGRYDAEAELRATIESLAVPVEAGREDLHTKCRFPARYIWLSEKLGKQAAISFQDCPALSRWLEENTGDSLSIVFATGILGNPASYYGHTLLKINASKNTNVKLLDLSINFGAIVPDAENPLVYILKGVSGGYDAEFSEARYYFHHHNYGDIENRNVWEYRLNLSSSEVQLIVAHVWEILEKKFDYYFFNKNCAYRLADLLSLVAGNKVLPERSLWVLPQAVIQKFAKVDHRGQLLVDDVFFYPSRQSRFYSGYWQLSGEKQKLLSDIVLDLSLLEEEAFTQLTRDEQYLILDVLIDYFYYIKADDQTEGETAESSYQAVLKTRFLLPPAPYMLQQAVMTPPHAGRDPSYFSMGVVYNKHLGEGFSLRLRPAYYDPLDAGVGHIPNAELIMGELELVFLENDLQLKALNIISLEGVTGEGTGLPEDGSSAWKLNLGVYTPSPECGSDCLIARFGAGAGRTWQFTPNFMLGVFGSVIVQDKFEGRANLALSPGASLTYVVRPALSARLEYDYFSYIDGKVANDDVFNLEARWEISSDWDIRLGYRSAFEEEISLSMGYYW